MFDALRRRTAAARRERAAAGLPGGPLRRYLETAPPGPDTPLADLPLLAVDVETTGFDPRRDRLLSVGFVPVDGDRIVLAGAGGTVVRGDGPGDDDGVGQSAVLHGLTDDALATGRSDVEALDAVLDALTGRVLLAHFTQMETGFLGELCTRLHGVTAPFVVVDTLELHHRLLTGGPDMGFSTDPSPGELRLWAARERYGLPVYRAHDAVVDALACAELYLAQIKELGDRGVATLGALTRR
ncbi:exonuclease domain-containing protein [Dietzia sp. 179-F 9C3 NHS]|uniref:exonuclease domain-containing protein n=1 Tax=Dietzia sp. 179-F 9C3 NHS TaxID=3374295 RepID=UPI00387933B3